MAKLTSSALDLQDALLSGVCLKSIGQGSRDREDSPLSVGGRIGGGARRRRSGNYRLVAPGDGGTVGGQIEGSHSSKLDEGRRTGSCRARERARLGRAADGGMRLGAEAETKSAVVETAQEDCAVSKTRVGGWWLNGVVSGWSCQCRASGGLTDALALGQGTAPQRHRWSPGSLRVGRRRSGTWSHSRSRLAIGRFAFSPAHLHLHLQATGTMIISRLFF